MIQCYCFYNALNALYVKYESKVARQALLMVLVLVKTIHDRVSSPC